MVVGYIYNPTSDREREYNLMTQLLFIPFCATRDIMANIGEFNKGIIICTYANPNRAVKKDWK